MSRPHPWTDGYVVAVAAQILWTYKPLWTRLTEANPSLSDRRLRELLDLVKAGGNPVHEDTPPLLPAGHAVQGAIEDLYAKVVAFRETVAREFTRASEIPDQIFARCDFPRAYRGLPPPTVVGDASDVEILNFGDMPPLSPDWVRRHEVARYGRLLWLSLFNCGFGRHPLGIDLSALSRLRALDLRENGLSRVPPEIGACRTLEFLDLSDNPLSDVDVLSSLTALRYLGLARTGLPLSTIEDMSRRLPGCEIS